VSLPYGLEAYAPLKHLKKDDGSMAAQDESITVKVIEFNRDDKRILVSHSRYLEDIRREADEKVRSEHSAEEEETKKVVKKTQDKVEKSTMGDMDAFAQLRQQLSDNEKAEEAAEEKPKAKSKAKKDKDATEE
jgi:small subunit ribosomal protein S1